MLKENSQNTVSFNSELIIKRLIEIKNFRSERDLAVYLGVSNSTIKRWREQNIMNIFVVADHYREYSMNYIIYGIEPTLIADCCMRCDEESETSDFKRQVITKTADLLNVLTKSGLLDL